MTLTKDHIIDSIHEHTDLRKSQAIMTIESLLEILKKTLESGEDILISGFGKFCVREKKRRHGRNPQTGGEMTLEARKVITFRCSPVLKDKINKDL